MKFNVKKLDLSKILKLIYIPFSKNNYTEAS